MRKFEDIRIAVAGTGYVGLSIATLLAQHHPVTAVDVIPEKELDIIATLNGVIRLQGCRLHSHCSPHEL